MAILSLTDPINGTTADASLIATNNAAIKTVVNGGIEDVNIAADAAISGSKLAAPYTSYTPTWTATGTAPDIGNATVRARWANIGKIIHCYGDITFGSTSTFGTGTYKFALPSTASSNASAAQALGSAFLFESAGSNFGQAAIMLSSTLTVQIQYGATYLGALAQIGQTAPWTWAQGDIIGWSLVYESS